MTSSCFCSLPQFIELLWKMMPISTSSFFWWLWWKHHECPQYLFSKIISYKIICLRWFETSAPPFFFLFLSTWTFRIVEFENILTCICVIGNVQSRSEEGFFTGSHMPCLSLNRNWCKGKARHLHKKWARNLRYCETVEKILCSSFLIQWHKSLGPSWQARAECICCVCLDLLSLFMVSTLCYSKRYYDINKSMKLPEKKMSVMYQWTGPDTFIFIHCFALRNWEHEEET